MAIVRHLESKQLDRETDHTEAECTYSIAGGRNVWKGIWNYSGAITISFDRIGR